MEPEVVPENTPMTTGLLTPVEWNTVLSSMSVRNGIIVITQGKKWMTMNSGIACAFLEGSACSAKGFGDPVAAELG